MRPSKTINFYNAALVLKSLPTPVLGSVQFRCYESKTALLNASNWTVLIHHID